MSEVLKRVEWADGDVKDLTPADAALAVEKGDAKIIGTLVDGEFQPAGDQPVID